MPEEEPGGGVGFFGFWGLVFCARPGADIVLNKTKEKTHFKQVPVEFRSISLLLFPKTLRVDLADVSKGSFEPHKYS